MNKEELKELARTLDGIAEGKAWEIHQWNWQDSRWEQPNSDNPITTLQDGYYIRLKPWTLPPAPEGMQYHQPQRFTEAMLPDGKRPMLVGEAIDDLTEMSDGWRVWIRISIRSGQKIAASYESLYRTTRPLPQPDPLEEVKAAFAAGKPVQFSSMNSQGEWNSWYDYAGKGGLTIDDNGGRRKWRIKPETREVPLGPDDIKAGDLFISPCGSTFQWGRKDDTGIDLSKWWRNYNDLMKEGWKIRSLNETEWRKCSKTEEVPNEA